MADENPYQTPHARVEDALEDEKGVEDVRVGQRLVIFAVLLYILTLPLTGTPLALWAGLLVLVVSLVAVVRLARGFGLSTAAKVGLVILMLLPLVNLLTLVVLSSRATARLREAGYKVGLLGARAKAKQSQPA